MSNHDIDIIDIKNELSSLETSNKELNDKLNFLIEKEYKRQEIKILFWVVVWSIVVFT